MDLDDYIPAEESKEGQVGVRYPGLGYMAHLYVFLGKHWRYAGELTQMGTDELWVRAERNKQYGGIIDDLERDFRYLKDAIEYLTGPDYVGIMPSAPTYDDWMDSNLPDPEPLDTQYLKNQLGLL